MPLNLNDRVNLMQSPIMQPRDSDTPAADTPPVKKPCGCGTCKGCQ